MVELHEQYLKIKNEIAGQIVLQSNYFRFKVKNNVPDQHQIFFDIHVWDKKSNSWNSFFSVILNAPSFDIVSKIINDSLSGNNNHRLDPGETIKLKILNFNNGHDRFLPLVFQ